ncbi:hypothetical protein EVAR_95082_1 [Eumeta japonica]|uniref:Uncharacterized protein n=1 Tax=Eumeta variegata TaxID=151549 RepID=A0A4C1W6U5_EUMVA|nr:hypothetical protein EVAR_95082_1 [Eumeta japonica]
MYEIRLRRASVGTCGGADIRDGENTTLRRKSINSLLFSQFPQGRISRRKIRVKNTSATNITVGRHTHTRVPLTYAFPSTRNSRRSDGDAGQDKWLSLS